MTGSISKTKALKTQPLLLTVSAVALSLVLMFLFHPVSAFAEDSCQVTLGDQVETVAKGDTLTFPSRSDGDYKIEVGHIDFPGGFTFHLNYVGWLEYPLDRDDPFKNHNVHPSDENHLFFISEQNLKSADSKFYLETGESVSIEENAAFWPLYSIQSNLVVEVNGWYNENGEISMGGGWGPNYPKNMDLKTIAGPSYGRMVDGACELWLIKQLGKTQIFPTKSIDGESYFDPEGPDVLCVRLTPDSPEWTAPLDGNYFLMDVYWSRAYSDRALADRNNTPFSIDTNNTGVKVFPHPFGAALFNAPNCRINVSTLDKESEDYKEILAGIDGEIIGDVYTLNCFADNNQIFDSFGSITLSFPVGNSYNGKTVRIWHFHHDGILTSERAYVEDGFASIEVTDLSSFAVSSSGSDNSGSSNTEKSSTLDKRPQISPQTGDVLSFEYVFSLVGLLSVCVATLFACLWGKEKI